MEGSDSPCLKDDSKSAWALYFSKFISAYANYNISFWGLTVQVFSLLFRDLIQQNEPLFAAPWEACCYTAEEQAAFIRDYLGPQMKKDWPDIKIMTYDHNKDLVLDWAQKVYKDPEVAKYIDGTAIHWVHE